LLSVSYCCHKVEAVKAQHTFFTFQIGRVAQN
jgi:hypothetical protein